MSMERFQYWTVFFYKIFGVFEISWKFQNCNTRLELCWKEANPCIKKKKSDKLRKKIFCLLVSWPPLFWFLLFFLHHFFAPTWPLPRADRTVWACSKHQSLHSLQRAHSIWLFYRCLHSIRRLWSCVALYQQQVGVNMCSSMCTRRMVQHKADTDIKEIEQNVRKDLRELGVFFNGKKVCSVSHALCITLSDIKWQSIIRKAVTDYCKAHKVDHYRSLIPHLKVAAISDTWKMTYIVQHKIGLIFTNVEDLRTIKNIVDKYKVCQQPVL
jgi:hypothetical protein